MAESPIQPTWTLTRAQVSTILDENTYDPTDNKTGLYPIELRFQYFDDTGVPGQFEYVSTPKTKERIAQWCRDVFVFLDPNQTEPRDLGSHLERVDDLFSKLAICNFQVYKRDLTKDEIVDKACALLARLPAHPPELEFQYGDKNGQSSLKASWPVEYLCDSPTNAVAGDEDQRGGYTWGNLRVFCRPSTNVIRIALFLVMTPSTTLTYTGDYSDNIARVLDIVLELRESSSSEAEAQASFILQAYLWAAWHQTVMIQFWYDTSVQLRLGYMSERHHFLVSRQIPLVMPDREAVERFRPSYMCKWAFELLRSDLSSVTQDFRRLFEVFESRFGDRPSRCNLFPGQTTTPRVCDGKAPGNCQRFVSEGVKIQSEHDFECPGPTCSFLTWDEQSYMSVNGARAVCLETTDEKSIRYCPVSDKTMAVSHVWSHGQGGRPETGFNICLHRRYTALARSFGCTSYWMDTPCIPTDDELRDEAIGQINNNFMNSKITLLVDRDLMEIDINPVTLEAEEAILATLVVCDWNVRGWTLLEGIQGRVRLHILCKENHVISLKHVLSDVVSKASLSLVGPCLAIHHYTATQQQVWDYTEGEPVTTEQATCFLNHRHATKDRDLIIIWSLVCGTKVTKTAVDFWRSKTNEFLATGFLVSSSPRLATHRGLTWAPARPNILDPAAEIPDTKQYPAFDGQSSVSGRITAEGFRAEWLVCPIRRSKASLGLWFTLHSYGDGLTDFRAYYEVYNQGGNAKMDLRSLLQLRSVLGPLFKRFRWVALMLPAQRDRTGTGATAPARPFQYQGEAEGPLLVVVASNDEVEWEWQFVHEWDMKFRLPEFTLKDVLIV